MTEPVQRLARRAQRQTPGSDGDETVVYLEAAAVNANLKLAIREALARKASIEEIAALLREYKNAGMAQQEAYDALESLRGDADTPDADRLLEVMDVVSGFYSPHYLVW